MEESASHQDTVETTSDFIGRLRRSNRNRESYDEISDLEAKLRRAYIAKELETQLLERRTERYIEHVRKQAASKLMLLEQQAVLEEDLQQRVATRKKSEEYRTELSEQMRRKQEEKEWMMREARREREILVEVDEIQEQREKTKAESRKMEMMESSRRERLILEEMREIRRQEHAEAEAIKAEEDERYLREVDEREERVRVLRREQREKREKFLLEVAKTLTCTETQKREREALMNELMTEDLRRELLIREEEERVRRKRMKEELATDLEEQMLFSERCKLRFVELDKLFAEEVMRKMMEDERVAKLTAEARRRMQAQYREELDRLIETRRRIRWQEIQKMEDAAREEKRRENVRLEEVKEERKLLLERHVTNVGGFIDKSALTEEERRIFN
nr:PREDICTED: trichohyalin-like isoform X2 [Megachile rotundata]XP_012143388.1 PREDICTED: trichohyalin-like isoform X2 [Megachile rotundata]XP_012143390.1 PREDICTED: trichohyalin-like isoform X2 [Megachile rotundata]XP_012143391.1 PREDICTED: trichohyalin-like isoform X2 [Megachile rotundata]XP_012143392.1 PREDICTED: trichohyalin-like isoform X2 [Megachile rotundata]XP_012143393.1 PREDICTED: trichohyalin-like isoform X2 [Megachile rotundata]